MAIIFAAATAYADTDYRCLSMCVNNGRPASLCMPQCSYNLNSSNIKSGMDLSAAPVLAKNPPVPPTPETLAQKTQAMSTHKLLSALQPINNTVILPQNSSNAGATTSSHVDYQCVSDCTKQGMRYEFCSQNCTVSNIPSNTTATQSWQATTQPAAATVTSRPAH